MLQSVQAPKYFKNLICENCGIEYRGQRVQLLFKNKKAKNVKMHGLSICPRCLEPHRNNKQVRVSYIYEK